MQIQELDAGVLVRKQSSHRWGVILAGGDGKRLLPLTRRITGDDRPKFRIKVAGIVESMKTSDAPKSNSSYFIPRAPSARIGFKTRREEGGVSRFSKTT